jgi:hypothetical protein
MSLSKIATAFAFFALCAACGSVDGTTSEPTDDSETVGSSESGLALPPPNLKKCVAGPFTTYAYGNQCPDYAAVASGLCSLNGEFIGGAPLSHSCQPIPGSIPQQYSYSLTYQCYRPQPCRY